LRISARFSYKDSRMGELTLCQKLGIKEDLRVLVLTLQRGSSAAFDPLPARVGVTTRIVSLADVIVLFSSSRAVLGELFPKAKHVLAPRGALWVAWPRKSSGFFTDLDESLVRAVGLATGSPTTRSSRWTRSGRRYASWRSSAIACRCRGCGGVGASRSVRIEHDCGRTRSHGRWRRARRPMSISPSPIRPPRACRSPRRPCPPLRRTRRIREG